MKIINLTKKANYTNVEQKIFWDMLQKAFEESGCGLTLGLTRNQYGIINARNFGKPRLECDFLLQKKFLRINIYIHDDEKTPCFDRLYSCKNEIEAKLGFSPIWRPAQKGENTRRIETRLSFIPYDHEDYERLINEALPIFIKYYEVFSQYLDLV